MFLGFYNYTVHLTYLNALSGLMGILILINKGSMHNNLNYASICILISGICDMFDGFVSNLKKTRSIKEKKYGIQIDSLADIISFGILPILIGFKLLQQLNETNEMFYFLFVFGSVLYILAVLIRLAYFNVLAENDLNLPNLKAKSKIFIGLPVTLSSVIFPFLILSQNIFLSYNICDLETLKRLFGKIYLFFIILFSFLFTFDKIKFKKSKSIFFYFFIITILFIDI